MEGIEKQEQKEEEKGLGQTVEQEQKEEKMSENNTNQPQQENGNSVNQVENKETEMVIEKPKEEKIPLPFTPKYVLQHSASKLTAFEMSEILDYPKMYFFGPEANKIKGMPWAQSNNGYDDTRGDLRLVRHDHLAYRYEIIEKLGKGSFGQVVKAFDHKMQEYVAIKIIRNKKRFHRQALIEVKILDHIKSQSQDHSIVEYKGHFTFRNHLCLVFELLSMNLYELIKSDQFKGYPIGVIQIYAKQLLKCLSLLRKENIIHCDLKPENILLDMKNKLLIKVIDFGSSCFTHEKLYTYIQSRFYRSPEVVLGTGYNVNIDMWSLGCILAELSSGHPLFPGDNELDLLSRLIEVLGTPPTTLIKTAKNKHTVFDSQGALCLQPNDKVKPRTPGARKLKDLLKAQDDDFLDFLMKCLTWTSESRITPEEGLNHPWLQKVYGADVSTMPETISPENKETPTQITDPLPGRSQEFNS